MVRGQLRSASFSQSGRRLASASTAEVLWDVHSGECRTVLPGQGGSFYAVAVNSDGRQVAATRWDGGIELFDTGSGKKVRTITGHRGPVWGVVFAPSDKRLFSVSADRTVRAWDVAAASEVLSVKEPAEVRSVCISPDGRWLATGSVDGMVRVRDATTGEVIHTLRGHGDVVGAVGFSADGLRLASASEDRTARVWDANSGETVLLLRGHTGKLTGVSFTPDGKRVVTASQDGTVRLWDMKGQHLLTLSGHGREVWSVACSPDGHYLASGDGEGHLLLWPGADGSR